jgi:hypothetical protein
MTPALTHQGVDIGEAWSSNPSRTPMRVAKRDQRRPYCFPFLEPTDDSLIDASQVFEIAL